MSTSLEANYNELAKTEVEKEKLQLVWKNILIFISLHLGAIYGVYLTFTSAKLITLIYVVTIGYMSGLGITGGAHRLWSHRSYKAKLPLQILLVIFNTIAVQNSILKWARDHRVHHKFSETDADPHNSRRGFFFSHMGWLLCRKHADVIRKGQTVDISDLEQNALLAFQDKHYVALVMIIAVIIPVSVPMLLWNESFINSVFLNMYRYIHALHSTWLVNSAAHIWGTKPYNKYISPAQNLTVSIMAIGEGWHNYHHSFPWDYKAAELVFSMNLTTLFIEFCAKIGWAYDLKTVSQNVIRERVHKTGDGSHEIWGWSKKD